MDMKSTSTTNEFISFIPTDAPKQANPSETLAPVPAVQRDERGRLLPGSRLNPAGSKPGYKHMTTMIKEALADLDSKGKLTYQEALVKTILKRAIVDGNFLFVNMIMERLEGKVGIEDNRGDTVIYNPVVININQNSDPLLKLQQSYAEKRTNSAELES